MKPRPVGRICAVMCSVFLVLSGCSGEDAVSEHRPPQPPDPAAPEVETFDSAQVSSDSGVAPIGEADLILLGLSIGIDSGRVREVLGAPDSIRHWYRPEGHGRSNWRYGPVSLLFDRDGQRLGAAIIGGGVQTARGLAVGDSVSRLVELYGMPTREETPTSWRYMSETDPWLATRVLLRDGRVYWIYV